MEVIVKESQSVTFRRKIYEPGDEVDLPDKIAKHLIDTGVCEAVSEEKKKSVMETVKFYDTEEEVDEAEEKEADELKKGGK